MSWFSFESTYHLPPFLTHTTWKCSPLSQPTIHYHYQVCLLAGCISQQRHWCKILACAVTSTLPELYGCRAGGVSITLTRAKCLVSDPSSQWSMKRISELPFPGLIQSGGGRQNVKLVFKKTPLPSFWNPKFFIALHLSTEIRIYFLLFLSNIKINAEVRRIPWGKETPSFKSALVIPPPHFFSINACYAFYY